MGDKSSLHKYSRVDQTTSALFKPRVKQQDKSFSLASKVKLMWTLIVSVLLPAFESLTSRTERERRIKGFEIMCCWRLLSISYKNSMVNEDIRNGIRNAVGVNTKTRLYNIDPLKPHFYIVKLGFTGVYITVLISAQKHRLWVLV